MYNYNAVDNLRQFDYFAPSSFKMTAPSGTPVALHLSAKTSVPYGTQDPPEEFWLLGRDCDSGVGFGVRVWGRHASLPFFDRDRLDFGRWGDVSGVAPAGSAAAYIV